MWVCEASEVNIWTVFAVGPNGANNNKNKNNFASSRSDHRGPTIIKLDVYTCTLQALSMRNIVEFLFLASPDALEVIVVTH